MNESPVVNKLVKNYDEDVSDEEIEYGIPETSEEEVTIEGPQDMTIISK